MRNRKQSPKISNKKQCDTNFFRISDAVKIDPDGKNLKGHIAKKSGRFFIVVCEDGTEYKASPALLQPDPGREPKQVLTSDDRERLKFSVGDQVGFWHKNQIITARILRMNPKTALVLSEETEFRVSYGLLRKLPDILPEGIPQSSNATGGAKQDAGNKDTNTSDRSPTPPASARAAAAEKKLMDTLNLARRLLAQHNLSDWDFSFDDGRKRAGACRFREKRITVSREYALMAEPDHIRDTILHEIAHALAGPEHHHDAVWKKMAKSVGCSAQRCHDLSFSPPRWVMSCENDCWAAPAERRRRNIQCKICGGKIRYISYTMERFEAASARVEAACK